MYKNRFSNSLRTRGPMHGVLWRLFTCSKKWTSFEKETRQFSMKSRECNNFCSLLIHHEFTERPRLLKFRLYQQYDFSLHGTWLLEYNFGPKRITAGKFWDWTQFRNENRLRYLQQRCHNQLNKGTHQWLSFWCGSTISLFMVRGF